jgi:hypothetical protein
MSYSKFHILINRPLQILITVLVLLFVVAAADGIIIAIVEAFPSWENMRAERASNIIKKELTPEEKKQQRLDRSHIQFQEDGTIHFIFTPEQSQNRPYDDFSLNSLRNRPSTIQEIYDVNDNLLWQGKSEDVPYQYLGWAGQLDPDDFMMYSRDYGTDSRQLRNIQALTPDLTQTLEINLEMEEGRLEFWRYDPALVLKPEAPK